jgi:hypothetical protein
VENGPDLAVKLKTWTACVTESSGIETKEGSTTANECEMEVRQPNEETKSPATVLSTCAFKIEVSKGKICEVVVEPEGNKERKEVLFNDSGENDENLLFRFAMEGITTKPSVKRVKLLI